VSQLSDDGVEAGAGGEGRLNEDAVAEAAASCRGLGTAIETSMLMLLLLL